MWKEHHQRTHFDLIQSTPTDPRTHHATQAPADIGKAHKAAKAAAKREQKAAKLAKKKEKAEKAKKAKVRCWVGGLRVCVGGMIGCGVCMCSSRTTIHHTTTTGQEEQQGGRQGRQEGGGDGHQEEEGGLGCGLWCECSGWVADWSVVQFDMA